MSDNCTPVSDRFEVTSVVWIDNDGRKYRRVIKDGEIRDIPVGLS